MLRIVMNLVRTNVRGVEWYGISVYVHMEIMKIEITVNFPANCQNPWDVVLAAIQEKLPDIDVTNMRYTYFESNYGVCDFPPALMLSQFMEIFGPLTSFSSYITKCSGTYQLEFNNEDWS